MVVVAVVMVVVAAAAVAAVPGAGGGSKRRRSSTEPTSRPAPRRAARTGTRAAHGDREDGVGRGGGGGGGGGGRFEGRPATEATQHVVTLRGVAVTEDVDAVEVRDDANIPNICGIVHPLLFTE